MKENTKKDELCPILHDLFCTFAANMKIKSESIQRFLTVILLSVCHLAAWGDEPLIEYNGDHYVINVEALNPDSEMALIDVLYMCPELMPENGKTLGENYILCVDNIDLFLDNETFLEMVKACEVERILVYTNPSVSQGVGGSDGIINVYFKKPASGDTTGKAVLEGSTYGNGKLYTDATTQQHQINMKGYALVNSYFAKASTDEGGTLISRRFEQNAHVSLDWDMTPVDNLVIKLFQQFSDWNDKHEHAIFTYDVPEIERLQSLTASYTHTLNDQEATILAEAGSSFNNDTKAGVSMYYNTPYFYTELNTPFLLDGLWMLAGWEISYNNIWVKRLNRQQYLKNDLYVQFDYNHGPWVITLGNRFTMLDYWYKYSDSEEDKQWKHHRNANNFLVSLGYKWGRHYVQGSFNRDFFVPTIDDFYEDVSDQSSLNLHYQTNLIWRTELRYSYQKRNLALVGSVIHSWMTDTPTAHERLTGIRTSVTWHKGAFRLTGGVNYYHNHIGSYEQIPASNDNYVILKLVPSLLLGKGLRLSSKLLYHSGEKEYGQPAHLYASIKANKDLGRHCNIYAEFHDIAGTPKISYLQIPDGFHNRALTLGLTYRF